MCAPIAAVAAGIAVASTAASVVQQSKSAKRQAAALRENLQIAQEESRRVASSELFESMRAARREQGRIRTQAGEAGLALSSGSVEAMLMDAALQGELRGDRTLANMEARNRADVGQAESAASRIAKPTLLGAGLQIGSSALSGWAKIQQDRLMREARVG